MSLVVVAVALLCSSCQRGKVIYPVRGQVFVASKPAEGALVVFHPADSTDPQALLPSGVVSADGSFTLRCYDPQICPTPTDGAPAGDYLITITWLPANYAEYRNVLPDKLQGRYSDPKTSGLRATVKTEPNDLPAFQLDAVRKAGGTS
jgi:hypothetical protein